jgi:tRNA(Ile)-lysidine synthase
MGDGIMGMGKKKILPLTLNPELITHNHILVAVSGGADSIALLHLLHDAARIHHGRLTVAHLHHGIRTTEAEADAGFVKATARRLNIPFVMGRVAVPALAKRRGISLEMAAREARYAFLLRVARTVKADAIALAHTADDQVETVLLKLVRGAGRAGLSGMEARVHLKGIPVVRPMLGMSRADIESLLRERNIAWREDESNRDLSFLRNRVRHELLPLLERHYNPKIRETLLRTRDLLAAEDEWMDRLAQELLGGLHEKGEGSLDCRGLQDHPLAARRRVILAWLRQHGVPEPGLNFEKVSRVDSMGNRMRGSATLELAGGWRVHRRYDRLYVLNPGACPQARRGDTKPVKLKIPGITRVPGLGLRVTASIVGSVVRDRGARPGQWPSRCTLSLAVLGRRSLWIRCRRAGDRMHPYGMQGSKKIQDILVDAKVPLMQRSRIPLVECEGEVVWLPGYRLSRHWAIDAGAMEMVQLLVEGL